MIVVVVVVVVGYVGFVWFVDGVNYFDHFWIGVFIRQFPIDEVEMGEFVDWYHHTFTTQHTPGTGMVRFLFCIGLFVLVFAWRANNGFDIKKKREKEEKSKLIILHHEQLADSCVLKCWGAHVFFFIVRAFGKVVKFNDTK